MPGSKDAIRDAAAGLFVERGYAATPLRDIAARAGVDASLIIRHFGSKEELFLRTVEERMPEAAPLDGPLESVGEDFIRFVLSSDAHVRGVFLALLRASDADGIGSRLRAVHDRFFVEPLRARLEGPDADLRARLAASLVGGLLYSFWAVRDEALAAADPELIVVRYGALLQRLITP
ncbi:TetR/AcrR family transcriptional regulator [Homoserinibacter sp. YIM 151385]|uniref:TetR/AcrR family transcriptional regulator n=1 Tax=Homoserinibacter sp. YIM 151385 TaxID=2985506 RepID=UPI0022F05340|nr:TetR family transcriptional regulator [Homoserinibacter sp. YIM 151385]WBU37075.1 TetR family transcriptional regulator [Homoserinibacter sp. YIM 151385]